jgi:lysophospholipase L1-like esterase
MKNARFCLSLLCALCATGVVPVTAQVIKVACIGDSITYGSGVDTANAYPIVLGRLLGTNYQTRNFGVSGCTLLRNGDYPYWKDAAFKNATNYAPNIVTIKLGTNDSKPQNWRYKDQFGRDLRDMIDVFANLPSHPRIFVCLPVPAYGVSFDINPDIIKNEIIPILKQVAKQKSAMTVDLYTPLSGRPDLFADTIHPNAAGYRKIAEALAATLGQKTPGDYKEALDYGPGFYGDEWSGEPAQLRTIWLEYYAAMSILAEHLRRIFALAIGLPETYFADKFTQHHSSLRVINYPDQDEELLPGQLRAGAQTSRD